MCVINLLTHTELLRNKIELKLRVLIFKAGRGGELENSDINPWTKEKN